MDILGHLRTISEHRRQVRQGCFAVGLYFQGLTHDLSKYSPSEFIEGCRYYQGYRSPNNAEREDKGYSESWMHHKGRNKHHYEYWIDYAAEVKGVYHKKGGMIPVRMPKKYVVEMFMDRLAASRVYNKDSFTDDMPLKYYERSMDFIMMHPDTKKDLHLLLKMYAKFGEKVTFKYIKDRYLKG